MNVSTLMARCSDPKYATYRGDGQGRDTYITAHNGGLVSDTGRPKNGPFTGY